MNLSEPSSWYAIHTKPHQELRAIKNLTAGNIVTFFPHFCSSKFPFVRPLFTGYVFIYCQLSAMLDKIRFTKGVSCVVSFGGKSAVIQNEVIDLLQKGVDKEGVCPVPSLHPGDTVKILSGPMQDLKGVFEHYLPDGERVRILLSALAYSAHVDIARTGVAKLPVSRAVQLSSSAFVS